MPSSACKKCALDRKSTRLNSSHTIISYAAFCLKKKSHMYRPLADRQRGFLDGLGTGRMGMAGARAIRGGTAEFHQNGFFFNHSAATASDNVPPEHPIGF